MPRVKKMPISLWNVERGRLSRYDILIPSSKHGNLEKVVSINLAFIFTRKGCLLWFPHGSQNPSYKTQSCTAQNNPS
jgi:hypothetical protein